jgi:peptidoglycan/xylan/chitin deacetylase (PgdA/CDA1 family)
MKTYLRTLLRRIACAWHARTLVLVYHHVWDPAETLSWITTPPDQFAEQMAFLAARRLAVPLDTLLNDLRHGRCRGGGRVVVTFDDATVDTLGVAYPILRRYGVPATLFVPTGLIGTEKPLWWNRLYRFGRIAAARGLDLTTLLARPLSRHGDESAEVACWRSLRPLDPARREEALAACATALGAEDDPESPRPMSWDQLAELDRSGLFTFGAHSVSHPMLSTLTDEELVREVRGCRDALSLFASFRRVFAYPYGDELAVTDNVKKALRDAGFEAGFTTAKEPLSEPDDPMALGRLSVDDLRLDDFHWLIDHYLRS